MLNRRQMLFGTGAGLLGATGLFNIGAALAQGDHHPGTVSAPSTKILPPPRGYKHPDLASDSTAPVGAAMVCAIDISGSINDYTGEYASQVQALGEAIASDDFRQAIFMPGGPGSIALCVIDYDGKSQLQIPWVDFREDRRDKFILFGSETASLERRASGGTEHDAALENSAHCFENMPWESRQNSVNIMTDGTSSTSAIAPWRRLLAQRYDATIYALVTESNYSQTLNPWAQNNLITPSNTYTRSDGRPLSGGFVHTVATESQTQRGGTPAYKGAVRLALRRQVILQTAGLDVDTYIQHASLEELDNAANPYEFLRTDTRLADLPRRNPITDFLNAPVIQL